MVMNLFKWFDKKNFVGNLILLELSNSNENTFAVTRSSIEHPNVSELDFDLFIKDGLLPVCEHIYICLGTTIKKAGSQDEFRKVDFDYSLAYHPGNEHLKLVWFHLKDQHTTHFYLRVKGEIEEAIKKINFEQINIYRPSLLIGARSQSRFLEQLGQNFSFIINLFLWGPLKKYRSIKAQDLSQSIAMHNDKKGISYFYYDNFI